MRVETLEELRALREVIAYNPETGSMTWLKDVNHRTGKAGKSVGCMTSRRYYVFNYQGKQYRRARVAWAMGHGKWPECVIDHINHDTTDDRLCNLRDVSIATNTQNQVRPQSRNTHGFLGVYRCYSWWYARICVNKKLHPLGKFKTPEEAHQAYLAAKRAMHAGCTL